MPLLGPFVGGEAVRLDRLMRRPDRVIVRDRLSLALRAIAPSPISRPIGPSSWLIRGAGRNDGKVALN